MAFDRRTFLRGVPAAGVVAGSIYNNLGPAVLGTQGLGALSTTGLQNYTASMNVPVYPLAPPVAPESRVYQSFLEEAADRARVRYNSIQRHCRWPQYEPSPRNPALLTVAARRELYRKRYVNRGPEIKAAIQVSKGLESLVPEPGSVLGALSV